MPSIGIPHAHGYEAVAAAVADLESKGATIVSVAQVHDRYMVVYTLKVVRKKVTETR